ncbi:MAG: glutamine--fructose-6-phosphate transaminase (isomerizing), partial [Candidatus Omnitrophota bacterium]
MCGIFGYIGKKTNAAELVLDGLKKLEYRGYDSWGIAIKNQKSKIKNQKYLLVEKHIGKIGNAYLSSNLKRLFSNFAFGHTRWATHGGVSEVNAHPHLDCSGKIAIIHNGIIENYDEI